MERKNYFFKWIFENFCFKETFSFLKPWGITSSRINQQSNAAVFHSHKGQISSFCVPVKITPTSIATD